MLYCISKDIEASDKCRQEEQDEMQQRQDTTGAAESADLHTQGAGEGEDSPMTHKTAKLTLDEKILRLKTNLFAPCLLNPKLGTHKYYNMSNRLSRYLSELEESFARLMRKYSGDVLLFDTIFESGNLLRADRITPSEYRLYMQVDTNTRGH